MSDPEKDSAAVKGSEMGFTGVGKVDYGIHDADIIFPEWSR
jgi:hypothetical protein